MPNWVKNQVRFIGEAESIEKLKKFIITNEEYIAALKQRNEGLAREFQIEVPVVGEVSFNILVPTPTNIFQGDLGKTEEEKYGKDNWHDWRIANWGCKWDACESTFEDTDDGFAISFWTPWGVPEEWLEAVGRKAAEIGGIDFMDGEFANEQFDMLMGYFSYDFDDECLGFSYSDYDAELYDAVWGEGCAAEMTEGL